MRGLWLSIGGIAKGTFQHSCFQALESYCVHMSHAGFVHAGLNWGEKGGEVEVCLAWLNNMAQYNNLV